MTWAAMGVIALIGRGLAQTASTVTGARLAMSTRRRRR